MYEILLNNIDNHDKNSIEWKYENNNIHIKYSQYYSEKLQTKEIEEIEEIKEKKKLTNNSEKLKNIKNKKNKILPLDFVLNICNIINTTITQHIIKDKLKDFITYPKTTKVFGKKKCGEMLNGILNNKWNISLVSLMSFIFNTKFIYLNKEVLFDKKLDKFSIVSL